MARWCIYMPMNCIVIGSGNAMTICYLSIRPLGTYLASGKQWPIYSVPINALISPCLENFLKLHCHLVFIGCLVHYHMTHPWNSGYLCNFCKIRVVNLLHAVINMIHFTLRTPASHNFSCVIPYILPHIKYGDRRGILHFQCFYLPSLHSIISL